MKLLRNRDVWKETLIFAVVSIALTVFKQDWYFLLLGLLLLFISLHFTQKRYKDIACLSSDIDKILNGETLKLERYSEGELAILATEIEKMVIRLKEDAFLLGREKNKLQDSLADISHQLRTPLTSLNIKLSLLAEEQEEEKRLEHLYDIRKQLQRIGWLVEVLLKISKIDAGTITFSKKNVKVKNLIEEAVAPFVIQMELKNQRMVIKSEEECAFCDSHWTIEAISNILKNAIEHTPEEGEIILSAEETPIFTQISIKNKGKGIDKTDIPHLFERFYKGKNSSSESVGIGLALTQMIIAGQDGTVKVKNHDRGAEFIIKLYHS